jgi:hypothetical protein
MAYTPIQPDSGAQTGTPYKAAIEGSIGAMGRLALAFAPHEQDTPDMTVRLEAGALMVSGAPVEKAAQNSANISAPTTHPRIDRVVIEALTGSCSVVPGTEDASPNPPAIPAGKLPNCQIALVTTTTAIDNSMITDERIFGGALRFEDILVGGLYSTTTPYADAAAVATALGYGTWSIFQSPPSIYPPAQSGLFVKATSMAMTDYEPYFATDPFLSLIGAAIQQSWIGNPTNQRFHIDTGAVSSLLRVYYENWHNSGIGTIVGAKSFTLWGSNSPAAFADLTYGNDAGWTQLTTDISQLVQHDASDQADPHFINVTPAGMYRYYAFKFANNWGDGTYMGIRRVELQCGGIQWLRTA